MTVLQVFTHLTETDLAVANATLSTLPLLSVVEPDEQRMLIGAYQEALGIRIRHLALMHAFRETPSAPEQSTQDLGRSALEKVSNPSYLLSVAERMFDTLGIRDDVRLHPNMTDVMIDTVLTCQHILAALHVFDSEDALETEGDDWGEPPAEFFVYDKRAVSL